MSKELHVVCLPAGEMNTALALKAHGNGHKVTLWFYSQESFDYFQEYNESPKLPGFKLTGIKGTKDLEEALVGADVISFASRSWDLRELTKNSAPFIIHRKPFPVLISSSKGLCEEEGKFYTPSQVIEQAIPGSKNRLAVLSGPNFAEQIAADKITGTTVVARKKKIAGCVKEAFHNGTFWVDIYKGKPRDVEVIGAFKNVVGLIMGFAQTRPEYDENTGAFILQRGLREAILLCKAMKGNPKAILELCGVGDYSLLLNSDTSRNVQAGYKFGTGEWSLEDLKDSERTIEGVRTVEAARGIFKRKRIFAPLTRIAYQVIHKGMDPNLAKWSVLERNAKRKWLW